VQKTVTTTVTRLKTEGKVLQEKMIVTLRIIADGVVTLAMIVATAVAVVVAITTTSLVATIP